MLYVLVSLLLLLIVYVFSPLEAEGSEKDKDNDQSKETEASSPAGLGGLLSGFTSVVQSTVSPYCTCMYYINRSVSLCIFLVIYAYRGWI